MSTENTETLVIDDTKYQTTYTTKYKQRKKYTPPDPNLISAIIPGSIIALYTAVGKQIKRGDSLLVLEAMKMKNDIRAPRDGVIEKLYVQLGSQVAKGDPLIKIAVQD